MADIDSTATIESAIAHIPDDGGSDAPDTDLAADTSVDEGTETEVASEVTEDRTADAGEPVADAPAEVKPAKKNPKYVPWDRFDAQTKGKQEALKQATELQAKYAELEKSVADYKERALAYDTIETNPEVAVEALLADERYAKLLTRAEKAAIVDAVAEGTPLPKAAPVADIEAPVFPQPDVELADGSLTYRPETLEKHMRAVAAYERQAGQKELRAELEALKKEFGDRVKPFEEHAVNERLMKETLHARGKEWTDLEQHFDKDFLVAQKDGVKAWLRDQWGNKDANGKPTTAVKNAKAGLQQAVYAVLIPALKAQAKAERADALKAADDAKKRAISEQNTRAAAAGERPSAAAPSRSERPRTPEDVINAAIDRAGLAA